MLSPTAKAGIRLDFPEKEDEQDHFYSETLPISAGMALNEIRNEKFDRTTETNFAYIKEVSESKYDDKAAQEVTFIMLDGTEKTYTYAKSEANVDTLVFGKTGTNVAVGCVVDLEVNGELIMNATRPSGSTEDKLEVSTTEKYVLDVVNDRLVLSADGTAKTDYFMDDNMLVIRLKADGAFKEISDVSNIKEYDAAESKDDTLQAVWTYIDEDGEKTVVAMTFIAEVERP